MKVSWDYRIPNIWEIKAMFQTTNQYTYGPASAPVGRPSLKPPRLPAVSPTRQPPASWPPTPWKETTFHEDLPWGYYGDSVGFIISIFVYYLLEFYILVDFLWIFSQQVNNK